MNHQDINIKSVKRICTRCIMDTTDPEIQFDDSGQCSHCDYFDNNITPAWPSSADGPVYLNKMLTTIKSEGKGKRYDCIIGLSGGVDSSFLATKVAEWGLRPLVVHVDAGWNSELAVMNIEQICRRLDYDLLTHVVNWEDMRDLQISFLRSNLANQDVPQDHAFFAALYNHAEKQGIKHVISGSNFATENTLPQSWGYDAMDAAHVKAIHKIFGKRRLKNFPIVGFYKLRIKYPMILQMKVWAPLNYIKYDKDSAINILEKKYGWRYYGGKHYESRWTRFFQAHYLPEKFGYDKRKAHLSSLVLSRQISRDEALRQLNQPIYDPSILAEDKAFVAKKLRITIAELEEFISLPGRHYSEFPNGEKNNLRAKMALSIAKKIVPILDRFKLQRV